MKPMVDVEMGGGIATMLSRRDAAEDFDGDEGTVRFDDEPVEDVPLAERRGGEEGVRDVRTGLELGVDLSDGDARDTEDDGVRDGGDAWLWPAGLFPLLPEPSALVTLRESLGPDRTSNASRFGSPLLSVVHAHSSDTDEGSIDLALKPAPTPSTAALGLSCSLKSSQFA